MPRGTARPPREGAGRPRSADALIGIERRRIARDIHDHVGQSLAYLNLSLHTLRRKAPSAAEQAYLDQMIENVKELNDKIHDIIYSIRKNSQAEMEPIEAIGKYISTWQCGNSQSVDLCLDDNARRIPRSVNAVFFHVLRETLTNISKHALTATRVSVKLSINKDLAEFSVADDGPGLPSDLLVLTEAQSRAARQFGLLGIRERLEEVGGRLRVMSGPGTGTSVSAHVPLGGTCDDGDD